MIRRPQPAPCPGSRCLLAGQEHEHAPRRDPMLDDLLDQVAAINRAEAQHAAGTWRCPGCGRPWDALPLGHSWGYAAGGSCNAERTG